MSEYQYPVMPSVLQRIRELGLMPKTTKSLKFLEQPHRFTLVLTVFLSIFQILLASQKDALDFSFFWQLLFLGVPVAHGLYVLQFEFIHNLCFGDDRDRISLSVSTLATGIPYAEILRLYELEHVAFFQKDLDPQRPTTFEKTVWTELMTQRDIPGKKILYLFLYPYNVAHKMLFRETGSSNALVQMIHFSPVIWRSLAFHILFDLWILYYFGWHSLLFLWCSTYLSFCPLHPCATHLLFQHASWLSHHEFEYKEPSSYYGMMNLLTFNGGYHKERHDHLKIPWLYLPLVQKLGRAQNSTDIYQVLYDFIWKK